MNAEQGRQAEVSAQIKHNPQASVHEAITGDRPVFLNPVGIHPTITAPLREGFVSGKSARRDLIKARRAQKAVIGAEERRMDEIFGEHHLIPEAKQTTKGEIVARVAAAGIGIAGQAGGAVDAAAVAFANTPREMTPGQQNEYQNPEGLVAVIQTNEQMQDQAKQARAKKAEQADQSNSQDKLKITVSMGENKGINADEIRADLTPMGIYDQTVVTTEFLEQNPQNVIGSFEVVAADGTDSERYIISSLATDKTKLFLYKAKKNPINGQFDKKLAPTTVDAISIARPNAVSGDPLLSAGVLGNGIIMFGGGGDGNSNKTLLSLQFREEKRTVPVDMKEFGNLGPVMSIVPTSDNNKAIVTLRPGESQYGALFVAVDPQTRLATITPMAVGELLDLRPSIEPAAPGHQKFIARGYHSDIGGIHELDVDLANPKNIVETNLNTEYYFLANARYTNASGEFNDLATSQLSMKMININRKTGQETALNYTTWLNDKIKRPDFLKNSFIITNLVAPIVDVDSQGKVHIWFAGKYGTGRSGGGAEISHPIVGHYILGEDPSTNPNALTVIDPHPSVEDNVRDMRIGRTSGGTRIITLVTDVGEILIPIGADGSPDPTATIFGVGNGVGSAPVYQEFFPGIQRNTTQ